MHGSKRDAARYPGSRASMAALSMTDQTAAIFESVNS
jgi:hypothetical protein